MEQVIAQLLGHGPIGLVAVISLYFAYIKDKEVRELYSKMIANEEKRTQWVADIFTETNKTVRALQSHIDDSEED